jgi:hypothetical protein
MRKFIPSQGDFVTSNMDLVAAHVAHIRHISRTSGLAPILIANHGVSAADATKRAEDIVPYVQQGLHFHTAALQAPPRVRPVLRYYSYTNLAKAVVMLYEPPGFADALRSHGAVDITHELASLALESEVLKITAGVIPAFNSLVGWPELKPKQRVSLKELLVAVPFVGAELSQFYGLDVQWIQVRPTRGPDEAGLIASRFDFVLVDSTQQKPGSGNLAEALAILHRDPGYDLAPGNQTGHSAILSKARWAVGDESVLPHHHEAAQRLLNLGGQQFGDSVGLHSLRYAWRWASGVPIWPGVSAALMVSFALSSLYRYRAGLLNRIERSELSVILETFEGESDAIVLPTMRHLLYGQPLFVSRVGTV